MDRRDVANWQDKVFKMIIFFAILGCVVLSIAAYLINKTFSDIFSSSAPAPTTPVNSPTSHP